MTATPSGPHVLCVGLTPALQRTLTFDQLRIDDVNRARSVRLYAAGKGVNVARLLKVLGSEPLLVGFLGGDTGAWVADEIAGDGLACDWVPVADPTRNCHTLIESSSGRTTELVEEMACPSDAEWADLAQRLKRGSEAAQFVAIGGALPPGAPQGVYGDIVSTANQHGVRCLVDSQGTPLLEALAQKPFCVKLNAGELGATLGRPAESEHDLRELMQEMHGHGVTWVIVTQGADATLLSGGNRIHRIHPPNIEVVNPIGSGDAVAAGVVHALLQDKPMPEAIVDGIACGTAAAMEEIPGQMDPDTMLQIRSRISVDGD